MAKVDVSIVGGSGYVGGELLRLLLFHPKAEVRQVTSEKHAGQPVGRLHPNLKKSSPLNSMTFSSISKLKPSDLLFLALPHGKAMDKMDFFKNLAPKVIDLSSDFRLRDPGMYEKWYQHKHPYPHFLKEFVYGIPELHREEIKEASLVACAGCNATATIIPLYPLYKKNLIEKDNTVVEVKAGSSQGGNTPSAVSHHPERSGSIRTYKPYGHRHTAEMIQELGFGRHLNISFTATSIEMVRGIHAVCHLFLKEYCDEKTIWKIFRQEYGGEPFIRIIKEKRGLYRQPDPKILMGSNYCDIGFDKDPHTNRLVVFAAIDNLMKGAAGQAIQAFNIMNGFEETLGLEFPGLHPL
jgi:N-acetyl-gamma-glutamyl-phosphate/LysW-gamma-L-alpha-aminoadipyl-6-phosphate reductase